MNELILTEYRSQIERCAQTMALGDAEHVLSYLERGSTIEQVLIFTDGNLDKRLQKVLDQVELLKSAFDNLDDLVAEYIKEVPLAAYDTGSSDGNRFLNWLSFTHVTTLEQQDYIACQLARNEVENIARANRLRHIRFQELQSMSARLQGDLKKNPKLRIHLNSIRTWTTFQTSSLLDEESVTPTEVLFFASGSQIRTSVFEQFGNSCIEKLAEHGSLTIAELAESDDAASRKAVIEFCIDAAEIGLVAFG